MTSFDAFAFGARGTLAGVPKATIDDLGDAAAVVVGAPLDWGTTYRPGARFGPAAIRDADPLDRDGSRPNLATGLDPLGALKVVDVGDVRVVPGYLDESLERIRAAVAAIGRHGALPIVLGGDHSITFATAGAMADVLGHGDIALIHFDAHADTAESHHGMLHGHGTPMRRLIESGAVPGHRFVQIGLRGYWPPPKVVAWMKEQSMRSYTMTEIESRGLDTVLDDAVMQSAADAAGVFISVDVDVVDPGAAPGTGFPEPGGLSPREILGAVRRLARDLHVVGADVVEVAPGYDTADVTALLANRIVLELLHGVTERRLDRS